MTLFLRLWFAFVAILVISGIGLFVWAGVVVIDTGPEGIGEFFGRVVSGYESIE